MKRKRVKFVLPHEASSLQVRLEEGRRVGYRLIRCPFCQTVTETPVRLLTAAGKPCSSCGAVHRKGTSYRYVPKTPHPEQQEVRDWLVTCFGPKAPPDTPERARRFLEEALELVQAAGMDKGEAQRLMDYVFARPPEADLGREYGGTLTTVLALAESTGHDFYRCGIREMLRCWDNVDHIRAKYEAKPPAVRGE